MAIVKINELTDIIILVCCSLSLINHWLRLMILLLRELALQEMYCQFGAEINAVQRIAQIYLVMSLPILIIRPTEEMSAVKTMMKIVLQQITMIIEVLLCT